VDADGPEVSRSRCDGDRDGGIHLAYSTIKIPGRICCSLYRDLHDMHAWNGVMDMLYIA